MIDQYKQVVDEAQPELVQNRGMIDSLKWQLQDKEIEGIKLKSLLERTMEELDSSSRDLWLVRTELDTMQRQTSQKYIDSKKIVQEL